jgi:hydroxypyruvate reductase
VTQNLLACGATIREVNTVRKHLSQLKGGQLARLARPAQMAALILSDVIGDPLDVIASGPTAPDTTSFADALNVLRKYAIEQTTPANVVNHLRAGAAGKVPETPKPGDPLFDGVQNLLVANNSLSVEACAREAEESGYRPLVLSTGAAGEARDVAREHVALARKILAEGKPVRAPACVISGGETTVTLRGKGLGGRNQEFALAAAGTDGTDGPTDAAGAFADATTVSRARALGLNAEDCLARNDSYHFFEPLGDLLRTGPTGTNVMDLYLMLLSAES